MLMKGTIIDHNNEFEKICKINKLKFDLLLIY